MNAKRQTRKSLRVAGRNLNEAARVLLAGCDRRAFAPEIASHLADLIKNGVLVDTPTICTALGWTRYALTEALADRRIFFVRFGRRRFFPAFFADAHIDRSYLQAVSHALADLPGGSKLQFFLSHRGSLGGQSVLQALRNGATEEVIAAAGAFVEG